MNVFMVGGTGLLGAAGAAELIRRGHHVRTIALPPAPPGSLLPAQMELTFGNIETLGDDAILEQMAGCDALVFAAGVDERIEGPPPIYDLFCRHNIRPLERLLRLAKASGIRKAVVLGSYFTYFARLWPELKLAEHHPYIRSRIDQAAMALGCSDADFAVCILELPYIFGAQPGRRPVWVFLVEQLLGMPGPLAFYPRGGTAMVTVRQVGQFIAGAVESGQGGRQYPVGWFNLSWKQLLQIMYRHMGQPRKKIITIPTGLFKLQARRIMRQRQAAGTEPGLDFVAFSQVMTAEAYIGQDAVVPAFGVTTDDLDAAIGESVKLSLAIIEGQQEAIGMEAALR
jgi:dihydroflavonol-4-reductase